MKLRAYNRFDECWFVFDSEGAPGGWRSIVDAVKYWNSHHGGYWEIGAPCIAEVRETGRAA